MARSKTMLGAAVVASLAAAGAAAGTHHTTSVSGITRGATVTIQGEVQCPQGQRCNPQITVTLTIKDGALVRNETRRASLEELDATGERQGWHEDFAAGDLPAGKTFMGTFEIQSTVDVTFRNVKATVDK